MKKEILNCLTYMANKTAETVAYGGSWGVEFCQKEIKEAHNKLVEELRKHIDWNNLTVDDCKELRFNQWSDELPIWLIPIWLLDVIPAGMELTCISGEKVVFNSKEDIDIDTRFGCLAYGIYPKVAGNEAE